MSAVCPRSFEAEAWRDGRLNGAEAERFHAHAKTCPGCTREMQSLEELAASLHAPVLAPDELHVRRERTRLLAAFDARLVPAPRRASISWWLVAAAAALTCATLALVFRGLHPAPTLPLVARQAEVTEPIVVRADSSARWSRQTEPHFETVRLESGALSIHVDHAASARRLRVLLPDGELEDIGTTFSVSADAGHTTRVSVQEGSVVLRLRQQPPLALGAGDSWSPAPIALPSMAVAAPAVAVQGAKPSTSLSAGSGNHSAPSVTSPSLAAATAPSVASASAPSEQDPAAEFRAAMAALNRGDNGQAATLFGAFVTAHPGDSHAEDAAYLRVLALQRTGSTSATQKAAQDYLQRYPHGFRQAEIERLASER